MNWTLFKHYETIKCYSMVFLKTEGRPLSKHRQTMRGSIGVNCMGQWSLVRVYLTKNSQKGGRWMEIRSRSFLRVHLT